MVPQVLDGEMVIDTVGGVEFPRFLIYDIVRYEGVEVRQRPVLESPLIAPLYRQAVDTDSSILL